MIPSFLKKQVVLFKSVSDEFKESDGYQYDLCDLVRQALSNRFYTNQAEFSNAYSRKDIEALKILSEKQLNLLQDMDSFLANRSEFSLSRWIEDSHRLAGDEQEKKYFDFNARTLITLWGDVYGENMLYDYSWREWSGLIGEFYFVRWKMFYDEVISQLEKGRYVDVLCTADFVKRKNYIKSDFGKRLNDFENKWINTYSEYPYPADENVISDAQMLIKKWNIGA